MVVGTSFPRQVLSIASSPLVVVTADSLYYWDGPFLYSGREILTSFSAINVALAGSDYDNNISPPPLAGLLPYIRNMKNKSKK